MLTIPVEKFDIYRIVNPSEIVINLQHFRSILYFGDRCGGMSVNVHFEGNSKPMIIAVEENIDFRFEFFFSLWAHILITYYWVSVPFQLYLTNSASIL